MQTRSASKMLATLYTCQRDSQCHTGIFGSKEDSKIETRFEEIAKRLADSASFGSTGRGRDVFQFYEGDFVLMPVEPTEPSCYLFALLSLFLSFLLPLREMLLTSLTFLLPKMDDYTVTGNGSTRRENREMHFSIPYRSKSGSTNPGLGSVLVNENN